jgi:hypothetical protein
MKTKEQISREGIGRRSFLLRIFAVAIAGIGLRDFINRFVIKKKPLVNANNHAVYPTIHPLAVARKKKNV